MTEHKVSQSGQVLLITLLILSVAITIVLSLLTRVRTDVTITTEVEESARAFSAAEAGIEEALKSGLNSAGTKTLSDGVANYSTNVSSIGSAPGVFSFTKDSAQQTPATVWLVEHNPDDSLIENPTYTSNTIILCWRATGQPAVGIGIIYKRGPSYLVAYDAFDPAGRGGFNPAGGVTSGCGQNNVYTRTITFSNYGPPAVPAINVGNPNDVLLGLRLVPYYAATRFYVQPVNETLPGQGRLIESTGTTNTGITRKIYVTQEYRAPSLLLDAAVISQTSFGR